MISGPSLQPHARSDSGELNCAAARHAVANRDAAVSRLREENSCVSFDLKQQGCGDSAAARLFLDERLPPL